MDLLELAARESPPFDDATLARFWSKVDKSSGPDGCWLWIAYRTPKGYGDFSLRGLVSKAYRVSYAMANGGIPFGLQIDHLCRNPACVNPAHLEAVTPAENTRRGLAGPLAKERAKLVTHCPVGHPYDDTNTYVSKRGKRHCKPCALRRQIARRAALKEAENVRTT